MARYQLSCGVPETLYDQFLALLPPGKSINLQMRELAEAWVNGTHADTDWGRIEANWTGPPVSTSLQPTPVPVFYATTNTASVAATVVLSEPLVTEPAALGDPGCTHPRGTLTRDGHLVRCGLCQRVVNR